ncbi:microcystin dependent MdpB family protein [Paenibacillus montaniterrae]|uniref:Microcystin dependent MdpB family protein n=1 Tax=Paenibacillus montaniterrae TaxID=429341 RepID=A0A919YME6_9BACL|nr:tail fiber protein [Paenibacillus montaniterrae]GIP15910.1 microcystin dependent MdpB family protein [Paenibacillus montaniterrae]
MADSYVGEIRIFAGSFEPVNWFFCDGRLLSIPAYSVLYSILGTTYGGDGKTNFALPDLRGCAPMHAGAGSGLTPRPLGVKVGSANVTLSLNEMPAHTHLAQAALGSGSSAPSNGAVWTSTTGRPAPQPYNQGTSLTPMSPLALTSNGAGAPHNNMQPYVGLNFIICTNGEYPPKS